MRRNQDGKNVALGITTLAFVFISSVLTELAIPAIKGTERRRWDIALESGALQNAFLAAFALLFILLKCSCDAIIAHRRHGGYQSIQGTSAALLKSEPTIDPATGLPFDVPAEDPATLNPTG